MDAMLDYLAQDRRHALNHGATLPTHTSGSAIFADISGWTALTTQLTQTLGSRRGIEELTRQLNAVYDLLVAEVDRFGGSVVHFAGDGITCWFAADSGQRAIACALAMQASLQARREASGQGGPSAGLALRAAITSGDARRFVVGDPAIQYLDLLTGPLLNRLGRIEALAGRNEVVADAATLEGSGATAESWRDVPDEHGELAARVGVLGPGAAASFAGSVPAPAAAPAAVPAPDLAIEQIRPWLIPAVFSHLSSGQGEFLTELRPAAILFARFTGLDYADDPAAAQKLDDFVCRAQAIVQRYDGTLLNLSTDAAGNVLSAAFGVPKAHQNDPMRAVAAAYELRQAAGDSAGISGLHVGICQGVVWSGAYGAASRRTYGVLGDEVNVAARLMGQAAPGQVLASAAVQAATAASYRWHPLPPRQIKGKQTLVEIFSLDAPRDQATLDLHEPSYALPMVGRAAELALIESKLALAARGRGQIIGITAEAGMGKSRLLAETIQLAEQDGWTVYGGACQSYATSTPYLVWQSILRAFFGLGWDLAPAEQRRRLAAALESLDPALLPRLPLLGVALNLPLPDNQLTGGLDTATRKKSLEGLIIASLRAAAQASGGRILLVLEDCHWIDPLSHDLLERVCRAISHLPIAIITVYRPFDLERLQAPRIVTLAHFTQIPLAELAAAEAETLIRALLDQRGRSLPAPLVEQLVVRSQGIPFYLEELVNYIEDQSTARTMIELPASLHSLILSRVDLLSDQQKITIKVASIIGRLFRAGWLWGYYPALGGPANVLADLATLSRLDITPLELPEPELTYLFKHAITHEVVYESLPYAMRAELHEQFAAYLEADPQLNQKLPLLAFHYTRSNNMVKRQLYNRLAGDAAQAAAAHATALEYYADALPLLDDPEEQAAVRFQMGGVADLIGRWDEAIGHYDRILDMAAAGAIDPAWRVRCLHARGRALGKQGEFGPAMECLTAAEAATQRVPAGAADRSLRADILTEIAGVKWRQGALAEGQECLELALALALAVDDRPVLARIYNTLGNLTYSQGDLPAAVAYQQRSFQLRQELGDRRGMTSSLTNLGMAEINVGNFAAARPLFEQSLEIAQEIGDVVGTMIGAVNIATLDYKLGDFTQSRRGYRQALLEGRDLGDRLGLTYAMLGMAAVDAASGQDLAGAAGGLAAVQAALALLGATLEPYEQAIYDESLALVSSRLAPAEFAAAWEAGLALALGDAVAAALDE